MIDYSADIVNEKDKLDKLTKELEEYVTVCKKG